MMDNLSKTMDKIVAYCKGRGFIYSGSEIYGGWPTRGTMVRSAWS